MEASPRLLLALEETSAGLARLAGALDAVAFRAVWRGFAASVNKLLYNDCATEARFSPQVLPCPIVAAQRRCDVVFKANVGLCSTQLS